MSNFVYVNPLGKKSSTLGTLDSNDIGKLKDSIRTINARHDDEKIKIKNHNMQLTIWSVTAGVSIIVLLILLRGIISK
tara:strand:+ start:52 stop:285 length:234 start_codon:yes stop_codon:yes gene_type:complete